MYEVIDGNTVCPFGSSRKQMLKLGVLEVDLG